MQFGEPMMISRCPTCGGKLPRGPVGRPKLQVPVQNVLGALRAGETVTSVARTFGISRASVYRIKERPENLEGMGIRLSQAQKGRDSRLSGVGVATPAGGYQQEELKRET